MELENTKKSSSYLLETLWRENLIFLSSSNSKQIEGEDEEDEASA